MERKILVVDNNLSEREQLYDSLTKEGFKTITTASGKEAIQLFNEHKPELILLDFNVQDVNGLMLLKQVRTLDPSVKIVMLSDSENDFLENEARGAGAGGFLRKNLGLDVMGRAVNEILRPTELGEKKIMVVDDDDGVRDVIRDFLKKKGYRVITAANGEEALEKLKKEKPLIVLLDINLPGMDGLMVLKRLMKIDERFGVIMITGVKNQDVFEEAKKLGAFEYIVKPFDLNYLETSILVRIGLVSSLLS